MAIALTSSGSNRAASSSLTMARETERPSLAVGTVGGREEKEAESEDEMEKEEATASLRRLAERVRYSVSKGCIERRMRTVSGLQARWSVRASQRCQPHKLSGAHLCCVCVYTVSVWTAILEKNS